MAVPDYEDVSQVCNSEYDRTFSLTYYTFSVLCLSFMGFFLNHIEPF